MPPIADVTTRTHSPPALIAHCLFAACDLFVIRSASGMAYYSNPFEEYMGSYSTYTATTHVPEYTLHSTLMSINNDQSQIRAQMQQLREQDALLRRQRQAALRRLRQQRYASTVTGGMSYAGIGEEDLEEQYDEDEVNEGIRFDKRPFPADRDREVYERVRRMSQILPPSREYKREMLVREMLDPTPQSYSSIPFPIPVYTAHHVQYSPHHHAAQSPHFQHRQSTPQVHPQPTPSPHAAFMEPPLIDELPPSLASPPLHPQYFPEPQPNLNKRGSRRDSTIRRDSAIPPPTPPASTTTIPQTLANFTDLRASLNAELASIPPTIQGDVAPTPQERAILQHHLHRLEDILFRVDGVEFPTDISVEDLGSLRRERGDLVSAINRSLAGIEQHLQPGTPSVGSTTGAAELEDVTDEEVDDVAYNAEIQRIIQETLGRKKDEELLSLSRRSVTIEDVPDAQY